MNRRNFLASSAVLTTAPHLFAAPAADKPLRAGLIGTGWYGKCDLLRLMQVAPIEVVSLCDVDKKMLADAADLIAKRAKTDKKPRTYTDYKEMLKQKDLDVVLIATPDHWHALPMIAACESGADIYVQKPVSVDIAEGKAMLDAARKHKRTVQVGTATPEHPAPDRRPRPRREAGLARQDRLRGGVLLLPHAEQPDTTGVEAAGILRLRGLDRPRPAAALRLPKVQQRRDPLPHRGWWRAFMEYGNGIVGDMCIHMLDMVRWMWHDLGWPKSVASTGGDSDSERSPLEHFGHAVSHVRLPGVPGGVGAPHLRRGGRPRVPVGRHHLRRQGHAEAQRQQVRVLPARADQTEAPAARRSSSTRSTPKTRTRKIWSGTSRGRPFRAFPHARDLLEGSRNRRAKPVADIEQGYISTASCILANLSMKLGRSLTWDAAKHQIANDDEGRTSCWKRPLPAPATPTPPR